MKELLEEQAEGMTSPCYCTFDPSHCFQYYKFEKLRSKNWMQKIDPQQPKYQVWH